MRSARSTLPTHLVTGLKASAMSKWVWRLAPTPRPSAITSIGEESSHACATAPNAIWMPAALRPAMTVHTPICLPLVTREAVGHRDREALLAHHEDRHALLAERVVDRARRVAAHPRGALGLEDAREAVDRLDLHGLSFDLRISATAAA